MIEVNATAALNVEIEVDIPGHNMLADWYPDPSGQGGPAVACECGHVLHPTGDVSLSSISEAMAEHRREMLLASDALDALAYAYRMAS